MTQCGEATRCCWSSETSLPQPRAPPHEDTLGTADGQSPGREAPGGSVPRTSPQSREGEPTAPTPWCRLWGGAGQWLEAQAEEPAGKPGCVGSRQPPAWLREGGKEVERKKPEPVTHGNLGGGSGLPRPALTLDHSDSRGGDPWQDRGERLCLGGLQMVVSHKHPFPSSQDTQLPGLMTNDHTCPMG